MGTGVPCVDPDAIRDSRSASRSTWLRLPINALFPIAFTLCISRRMHGLALAAPRVA